jgi:anthranilate synthase component 1
MYLIKFSHVQHIVSDVVGELDGQYTAFDLLATILPGGVVSGAPKIETMKIIDRNEGTPRGPYGGAVGRFSFNGDCAFCLPIRSIFCNGDECFVQTSSGVVYDSVPENEYQEIRHKLGAMARAIAAASGR